MTRAYTYGLLPPVTNARLVADQMRRGHAFRNRLIEIERTRRTAVREIIERCVDPADRARLDALVAKRDEARAEILRLRAATRRRADTAPQRQIVRDLGAQIAQLRARGKNLTESAQIGITWARMMSYQAVRDARAGSGLYWGTYLLHEAAMRASATAPTPPEFIPWRGEGRVSVQLQGGISVDDLETDTQLQIQPGRCLDPGGARPAGLDALRVRGDVRFGTPLAGNGAQVGRGARNARVLRLRVGSDGRRPIWAEWPMQMHRPIPPGARIKTAQVSLRRRGTRWDWSAQITFDDDQVVWPARPIPTERAVALNLGYARTDRGDLRVGYIAGTDGREQEILTPDRDQEALNKADAIRSHRDQNLDAMRTQLSAWIAQQAEDDLPAWFRARISHLAAWRSAARFAVLARDWQVGWWDAGGAGYDLLERWRLRDLHLERYETGMRTTALRRRREGYRVLARRLADRYQTLVIDDLDLREFARLPAPESERTTSWPAVRRQRTVASPHELRDVLVNAFGKDRVSRHSAVDLTRYHAPCQTYNEPAGPDARRIACAGCGASYDQDANACKNLLREWASEPPEKKTARAAKVRSQRRHRIRKGSMSD